MYKKIKGQIIGVNFDLDFSLPHPLQVIYEFRLSRACDSMTLGGGHLRTFMSYALKHLPSGSFIMFSFDSKDEYFVQFHNEDGTIILDVPFRKGNVYYGKAKDLIELFRLSGLAGKEAKNDLLRVDTNVYYIWQDKKSSKKELSALFGRDYEKAAEVSLAIAESLFKIKSPKPVYFQTDRLRSAR